MPELPARSRSRSNFTRADYEAAVQRVVDYILAGDIFQANVSQRFQAELPAGLDAWGLYRRLRRRNPAPFAAFLDFGEVGDRLGLARAVPGAAGAAGRDAADQGHAAARGARRRRTRGSGAELLASAKDRAENVMIVDLLRNDLSRVCRDHTRADARDLRAGELRHRASPGLDRDRRAARRAGRGRPAAGDLPRRLDHRRAQDPGHGDHRRAGADARAGPIAASIGWLGFDGWMDTSITIRTFAHQGPAGGVPGRRRHRRRQRPGGRVRGDAGQGQGADRGAAGRAVILLIDNYDSFVWNLARYVSELGHTRIVVRNDATSLDDIAALAPTHIIVSPGPCTPTEAGISNAVITGFGPRIPILGVCLGHQCIGAALGGKVERARRPMHGKTSLRPPRRQRACSQACRSRCRSPATTR